MLQSRVYGRFSRGAASLRISRFHFRLLTFHGLRVRALLFGAFLNSLVVPRKCHLHDDSVWLLKLCMKFIAIAHVKNN